MDAVCSINCQSSSSVELHAHFVKLRLSDSTFRHTRVVAAARLLADVEVEGARFLRAESDGREFLGGLEVNVKNEEQPSSIKVQFFFFFFSSRFDQKHELASAQPLQVVAPI